MPPPPNPVQRLLVVTAALLLAASCGAPALTDASPFEPGVDKQALSADNGLNMNGLNMNGLNMNGLNMNGLNMNGLGTTAFVNWFNQAPSTTSVVMKYVYGCAAASGASLSWTNPRTNVRYTWTGVFGIAPGWVGGSAPTVTEQQLITACLAAHTNKYGVHVPIAVEGRTATGAQIPIGSSELSTYSIREGCFFGNLFTGEGVFGGPDHSAWDSKTSTARACVFDTRYKDTSTQCSPIFQVDYCFSVCKADPTNTFYETCTYNGKTYKALATRMRPQEQYKCGDGVCQFTESCGSGADWNNCKNDCGLCP